MKGGRIPPEESLEREQEWRKEERGRGWRIKGR